MISGQAQLCIGLGHASLTSQGQLQAGAQHITVQGGHDGLAAGLQSRSQRKGIATGTAEGMDVRARAEASTLGSQHQGLYPRVGQRLFHGAMQSASELG